MGHIQIRIVQNAQTDDMPAHFCLLACLVIDLFKDKKNEKKKSENSLPQ